MKLQRLSSRFHLALGLVLLLLSAMLMVQYLGLVPDRDGALRQGRVALAETIAISSTALMSNGDLQGLQDTIGFLVRRNPDLRSIGLRRTDGELVAATGEHAAQWRALPGGGSTDTQIVVPILQQGRPWGHAELRFEPLHGRHAFDVLWAGPWRLAGALLVISFVMFYVYLGRMLKHLDPSSSVPARVRTAFDTLAEGLLVLDPSGRIVLANRAFSQVQGLSAESLLGQRAAKLPWTDAQGAPLPADALPWIATQADGQSRLNVLLGLTDAEGKARTFMANCSPVPGAGGRPAGVLVSLDDVTELEQKEIELRIARDAAESANRAKSDFLANMSHEIRTPMNAILGFTSMLRRGYSRDEAESGKYLGIIENSGKHLLTLINDILDLSKVEAGRLEVERIACPAHELVTEIVHVMRIKADEGGITLATEFPARLPAEVSTDPSRLRQILTNLIGNALKFTPRGGTVTVRTTLDASVTPALLRIDVADSGIGIAADKLDAIFEPFVQAESSTNRRFGGTGLGLAISRRFARALGGDIVVTSTPGQGSVFRVTVQAGALEGAAWLEPAQLAALQPRGASDTGTSWRFPAARVLVVDDGSENRQLVRVVLETAGLAVVEAEHGAQALERLEQSADAKIDLVLMDVQMPVMNGYDATREIRARGLTLPVLALTANAMKGFEREIESAGFSGYLTKPVDIDGMLAELAQRLGGTREDAPAAASVRLAAALPTPEPAPATRPDDTTAKESTPMQTSTVGEPIVSRLAAHPRLRKVVRSFCLQLPDRLAAMRAAEARGDLEEIAQLAHWLKGAGGTVGFDAFFDPAKKLEETAKAGNAAEISRCLGDIEALGQRIVSPDEASAPRAEAVSP